MSKILTITLNPAVDLATSVAAVVAGPKLRCKPPRVDPGGGGVNVARAICELGGQATAFVAVAGAQGEKLLALLAAENVPTQAVWMRGETRQNLAVIDEGTGAQYRFGLPGEVLTATDGKRILAGISDMVEPGGLVVLSGSVAPGLGDDFPALIQQALAPVTDRLIVDVAGAPLEGLVRMPQAPLLMLRIDQKEAAQVAHHDMKTIDDSVTFAADLVARGVARMVVTGRGPEGSVMVTQNASYLCSAPDVPVRSKVGAGDAFVGAMTLAIARGETEEAALRWGVAAASATVGTEGTALCQLDETRALFEQCNVTSL